MSDLFRVVRAMMPHVHYNTDLPCTDWRLTPQDAVDEAGPSLGVADPTVRAILRARANDEPEAWRGRPAGCRIERRAWPAHPGGWGILLRAVDQIVGMGLPTWR